MPRLLLALALTLTPTLLLGQEPAKAATLRWFGQSFFQLETATGRRVVWDPHAIPEFGRPVVRADIVLVSHRHGDHTQLTAVENAKSARVFVGLKEPVKGRPADWDLIDETVGPVRVRDVPLYHDAENGTQRGKNVAWVVAADGLTYCHLGDLGHDLTPNQVKQIGPVDVLMVPVGGVYTLNGEGAKKAVAAIKPRLFVLPMHYGVPGYDDLLGPDEFLDGLPNVKRMPATNELSIPVDSKPDGPTVVVLGWKKP